jgi:nicotinamidase-related amidase
MNIWNDLLSEKDRAAFEKGRMGGRMGFGRKPAVLVIDMSYAFVEPDSPLAGNRRPTETIRSIAGLLSVARERGVPVLYTTNRTPRNDADWGRWKSITLKTHPGLKSEETWKIIPDLSPGPGESILKKTRPSGFFGTDLVNLLLYHETDTVIITGMTTSGCVRATVLDAFSYNFKVVVPAECVEDRAEISHKVSLMDMHMKYADVLPLQEVLEYLKGLPDSR